MAAYGTITFRPRRELEADFNMIEDWCTKHDVTFNAIINSYLPAISYALQNKIFIDEEEKKIYILSDFGHVPLLKGKDNQGQVGFIS